MINYELVLGVPLLSSGRAIRSYPPVLQGFVPLRFKERCMNKVFISSGGYPLLSLTLARHLHRYYNGYFRANRH
jgi:hypothetical protein